jgi:myo-inositol-1(or 4)-monophosphatase
MTSYESLLAMAHRAVDLGRSIARDRTAAYVNVKGDRDLVTEADLRIEERLRQFLNVETPDIMFLGEEQGQWGQDGPLSWVLDPLDGTSNFVHGLPLYAISLALFEGDRPVIGVIDLPETGVRYHSMEGAGSYRNGQAIHARGAASLQSAIVAVGDYATGVDAERKNRLRFATTVELARIVERVRMFGSAAIDLAWVADGKLDASVILSNKLWDTAAGVLIAREAGAITVDIDGRPHDKDSSTTVTVAPALATSLLQVLARASSNLQ